MHALRRASIIPILAVAILCSRSLSHTPHTLYAISNGISMNNLNMFSSLFSFPLLSFSSISSESKIVSSFQLKTTNAHFCTRVCVSCVWAQKREEYAKYSKRKLKNRPIDKCWCLRSFFIVPCNVRFICLFVCLLFFHLLFWHSMCHSKTKAIWSHYGVDSQNFVSLWRCGRIPCIHIIIHPRVCACFPTQHTQRGSLIHVHRTSYIRGRPIEYTQLKEKSHVQTSCSPSSSSSSIPMPYIAGVWCVLYTLLYMSWTNTHTQCRFSMNACFVFLSVSLPRCLCLVHTFLLNVQMCSNNIAFIHNRRF